MKIEHSKKQQKAITKSPYIPRPYTILEYRRETSDTFSIIIDMAVKHEPGQFVQITIPGVGEAPISISSYSDKYMQLTIREIGTVTNVLSKLQKGDKIFVRGPYGKGYPMDLLKENNLIILGGGCGVAPLRGIIEYVEQHRSDYRDVILFLGYRSPKDILYAKEIEEWRKKYNITVTVDQNASAEFCYDAKTGFITEALKASGINNENKAVFLCGPPVMIKLAIDILKQKGFHDDQIFISAERLMYCALGVCCHCMIHGKYTCTDGPVFRYDEIRDYTND